jgi:hypothetical protein
MLVSCLRSDQIAQAFAKTLYDTQIRAETQSGSSDILDPA